MDITATCKALDLQLEAEVARDPLEALSAIGRVERIIDSQQRRAVRTALRTHSWAEIGAAMGVTKQAAHQRFARRWVEEIKTEVREAGATAKTAQREGDPERAAAAKARIDGLIAEIKRGRPRT
jgi:hypothetical protein